MNILPVNTNNTNFNGYDAIRLRGLYMQGLNSPAKKRIFNEMKEICKKEGLDLFINQNNTRIARTIDESAKIDPLLSIWAQDRKAFVKKNGTPTILWHSCEKIFNKSELGPLSYYETEVARDFPRGGNYFIGYKDNGEKWLMINSSSVYSEKAAKCFGDLPPVRELPRIFDVKPENIYYINEFTRDLDESVRPVGYPYVLVNDYGEVLKNIEKLQEKFPNSSEIIEKLKRHAHTYYGNIGKKITENQIQSLEAFGFKPLRIGAHYEEGINFINALAFKNPNNKISYITNSTKGSLPELEYLEKLFEEDLRVKMPDIGNIHFVSGKEKDNPTKRIIADTEFSFPSLGFKEDNAIMNILANNHGGIHCMTAEIPDFIRIG